MKIFLTVLILLTFISCSETKNITEKMDIPEELKGCSFHMVADKEGDSYMRVVRCPNSSTTVSYRQGKSTQSTSTIEDSQETDLAALEAEVNIKQARINALKKLSPEERQALGL